MKYLELTFQITPYDEAAADVLAALLADAGCDTFLPSDTGLTAYIQQDAYSEAAINTAIANTLAAFSLPSAPSPSATPEPPSPSATPESPSPSATPESPSPATTPDAPSPATTPEASASGLSITFAATAAPDENWNATWEAEHHFEPITLPDGQTIQIIPRQAFGSGEHATTRLMLGLLSDLSPSLRERGTGGESITVIDAGCGTGILGIAALKLGAARVFAYDIDEWSVRNAEENYALNGFSPSFSPLFESEEGLQRIALWLSVPDEGRHNSYADGVRGSGVSLALGDARCLDAAPQADILLANINRNILLADLPTFVAHLKPAGHLLLSGFYETDIPHLLEKAAQLGLHHIATLADGDWRALHFHF